ncbi:condensation domain-containing protein [Nonomuraea guangzhouensis]|uniref:Condensation domain-containing protein n=1 Tax=Nonomuraea guangzhouensis TaxID=1291555 RepID=A0ABW4GX46_9ACTN|nr:condensation domain-containing protein [Nonomuraea guangzhouensis]
MAETSLAQRSLWFLNELDPTQPVFNISGVMRIRGPLDTALLERALNVVVDRHEMLRTVFEVEDGVPVQVILPGMPVTVPVREVAPEDVESSVRAEVTRPFDLAAGPLLRMTVLRVAPDEHVAVLVMHHIVTDGWSNAILFRELADSYAALAAGRRPELGDLPVQYADYAQWELDNLRGERLEKLVDYWSDRLAGVAPLRLAGDRETPREPSFHGDTVMFDIPASVVSDLERLAKERGATVFMVLLAAYQVLLHRHSGQHDVAVACPVANRGQTGTEGLIGLFVNALVMRGDLSGDPAFLKLLDHVKEVCAGAIRHQDLPFGKLVELLKPQRHVGPGTPLAQVMFVLQNIPSEPWHAGELTLEPTWVPTGTAKYALALNVEPAGSGYLGVLEYSTDLFSRAGAERLTRQFVTLLRGLTADPEQPISRLPLLTEEERAAAARSGVVAKGEFTPAHELVEARAAADPDAPAVIQGAGRVSYGELVSWSRQIARRLRAAGLRAETPVAVSLGRSAELVAAYLGILQAGGVIAPLAAHASTELLQRTGAAYVIRPAGRGAPRPAITVTTADGAELPQPGPDVAILPSQLVCGTDTHAGLAALCRTPEWQAGERWLCLAPVESAWRDVLPILAAGATLVLPQGEPAFAEALAAVAEADVTGLAVPASVLPDLAAAGTGVVPGSVLRIVLDGGPAAWAVARRLWAGRPVELIQLYRPEGGCAVHAVRRRSPSGDENGDTAGVRVLDPWLEPVPEGMPGEVYLAGPALGRGREDAASTAACFVPDPFAEHPGGRLRRTGDRARLRDGRLELLGRFDRVVDLDGYPVPTDEIETVLMGHRDVADCAVGVRPGELVAYVVLTPTGQSSLGDLRRHVLTRLPAPMVPGRWAMVGAIARDPSGDVRWSDLPDVGELQTGSIAPRTPIEQEIATIVADLLGLPEVGMDDNFLELGGHSLLAVQLVSRARDAFGADLPLRLLYAPDATLEAFARHLFEELARAEEVDAAL